jgi:hypothetical protein
MTKNPLKRNIVPILAFAAVEVLSIAAVVVLIFTAVASVNEFPASAQPLVSAWTTQPAAKPKLECDGRLQRGLGLCNPGR